MDLKSLAAVAIALSCFTASGTTAQEAIAPGATPPATTLPEAPPAATVAPAPASIPKGTLISVEIVDLVSSRTALRDDMFNLKLAEPLILNGTIVMPAGTPGKGQVVDVGKPGMGGKPGKLVLAARYLEFEGRQVAIRALNLDVSAKDNSGAAMTSAVVGGVVGGVVGLVITGGNMEVQPGTRARAKLTNDFVPVAPPAPAAEIDVQPPQGQNETSGGTSSAPQTSNQ